MRLLVFSKTTGYRHDSIPAGVAALRRLCEGLGDTVDATEDAAVFTPGGLAGYDALIFLSTSGEVFDDAQRAALEAYVRGGGGFVGIHAASTTEYDWPFFGELVGARFTRHPAVQEATVHVVDEAHPSTVHLGPTWTRVDEWYEFAGPPVGSRILLTVDESTYEGAEMGADHPLAWYHTVDKGRCFYTALGHTEESFAEKEFLDHVRGGIVWATGGDAT